MRDYLNKIKSCCDVLASAGQKIGEEDQVLHILSGLGSEYDPVMVSVTSRAEPCSLKEVHAMLLSFESRLEVSSSTAVVNVDGSVPAANTVIQSPFQKRQNTTEFQSNQGKNQFNNQSYRGGRGRSFHRGRGGRAGRNFNNNRPQCQLCHYFGHTADKCFYRFDSNYSGPPNTQATRTFNPSAHSNQLAAMVLSPEGETDSAWYADSGASNHVINELANLNLASEFHANSKLQVGNGTGLFISHIGNSHFKNSTAKPFLLRNLLHVPAITKNLLSVSQFARDNSVFF